MGLEAMNKDLTHLLEAITIEKRLRRGEGREVPQIHSPFSKEEMDWIPWKVGMAREIFRWGREVLADKDYHYLRKVGVGVTDGSGIVVFEGQADVEDSPQDWWAWLILKDDGSFIYRQRHRMTPFRGFDIPDIESMVGLFLVR